MQRHEIEVDEDLPNFFNAVKLSQADELIEENKNMHYNFGFEPNDPDTIEKLDEIDVPDLPIQGTPWYQMLSNKIYATNFHYIGAYVKEREKLIEDGYADHPENPEMQKHVRMEQSDLVVVLLNLAYIPDHIILADGFNFKPGW